MDRPVGTADKLLGKVTIKGAGGFFAFTFSMMSNTDTILLPGLYNAPIEGEADPILLELGSFRSLNRECESTLRDGRC